MRGGHQPTAEGPPHNTGPHRPSSMAPGILPSTPFTTPMPPVTPPRQPKLLDEADNSFATLLQERGVDWPVGGFAPGMYLQTCRDCGKRHMADKRAWSCLACVVAATITTSRKVAEDRAAVVSEGKRLAFDAIRALIDDQSPSPAVERTRDLTDTLELVRERLEGARNAPAYADEVLALAICDIDEKIGVQT